MAIDDNPFNLFVLKEIFKNQLQIITFLSGN